MNTPNHVFAGLPAIADRVGKLIRLLGSDRDGEVAEIGAAHALGKPIFVAFAGPPLMNQFYFARQLATVSIVAATPKAAWDFFVRWQNR